MIELDLEKAYDRIVWNFIMKTMYHAGLPDNLLHIIINCIKGGSYKLFLEWRSHRSDHPNRRLETGKSTLILPFFPVFGASRTLDTD